MIPDDIINKIKEAADIVEVIGDFVTLKKKGANFWGACPFHSEKTGSFCVSPARQSYKCFGCGAGGNVLTFLKEHAQMTFPESVKWLGKKYGIEVPERELTPEEQLQEQHRESLQIVLRTAAQIFESNLKGKPALEYLQKRGFVPGKDSILERYRGGYALPGYTTLYEILKKQGFSLDLIKAAGLVSESEKGVFDRFHDRIVFPFLSLTGNVTGFTGRDMTGTKDAPKYLNSPETEVFHKGAAIFGLYQAKKAIGKDDRVYWVEGQFDVLSFVQSGIENTVCGSGTAMTAEQIKILLRFTRNITLIYDADEAGLKAARKNIALLVEQGAAVRCISLPAGEDPDSMARQMDAKDLAKFLKRNEKDFAAYLAEHAEKDDPERVTEDLQEITGLIAKVRTRTAQDSYIKSVAKSFSIEKDLLWRSVSDAGKDLPKEEDIAVGFYGMEEALELMNQSGTTVCQITSDFEIFTKHYGESPAIYFKGIPAREQIQNLAWVIENVEFNETFKLWFDIRQECDMLIVLKELFRYGTAVNVLCGDGTYTGFVEYYVAEYGKELKGVPETQKATYVDRCAELISYAGETVRTVMSGTWAKSLDLKAGAYKEILKPYLDKRKSKSAVSTQRLDLDDVLLSYDPDKTPDYVTENDEYNRVYRRYGFYPLLNKDKEPVCYMFKNTSGSGHSQVADFYMIPLLHIYDQDSECNKRVIKINRLSRPSLYLEVKSKSLVKLSSFEEILMNEEALNFENGNEQQYKKIRQAMSYNYTTCSELKIFGQQAENFYAFANAIFHRVGNEFQVEYANDLGVMTHEDKNYYTPAYSKIYAGLRKDSDKYEQHRYFIFKDVPDAKRCSFKEWAALMNEVYKINDNGKWALLYAVMCAFRSDIHVIDRLFTALFFVGPTMSGKTQVAISVRSLFVDPRAPVFNLNSGTDAAFFTLMEGFRDVPQVLDEYNNKTISDGKFQGLKAITYDGDGKQKRKGISDRDIDTSKVNSPVVILGQETPEKDDNALTNRVVLCEVPKRSDYTAQEVEIFQRLKEFEKAGLCGVLFEVLKLRPLVCAHFKGLARQVNDELKAAVLSGMDESGDMVRIIKTVSLFLAMCKLLEDHAAHLKLPFTYAEFFSVAKAKIKWQLELISHTDKLAGFFKAIEVLINTGSIREGRDYAIAQPGRLTLKAAGGETRQMELQADTKVLYIRLSNLYALYAKSSYNSENATLSTIEQNIRSNPCNIGVVSSRKFRWKEAKEVPKSATSPEMVKVMVDCQQVSSCLALDYDIFRKYFDIDLERAAPDEPDGDHRSATGSLQGNEAISGSGLKERLLDLD